MTWIYWIKRFDTKFQASCLRARIEEDWWTLIVNSSGSFLLGLLTGYALIHKLPEHWQLGLGVGFCGGFTTMSTFAFDTAYLFQAFPPMYVAMYVSCSVMLGFFLVMFGIYAGDRLATRRGVS